MRKLKKLLFTIIVVLLIVIAFQAQRPSCNKDNGSKPPRSSTIMLNDLDTLKVLSGDS
jgi:hypothetical protein